jgi:sulfate permease, SulP family
MQHIFQPKLFTVLRKGYSRKQFFNDLVSGTIVGIVALPLAIAFAIASGVTPDKGLITAIVAGFIISVLGGSRVQIGGPTGAFVIIVYGIIAQYGINGLVISTFLAGLILILFGVLRIGGIIQLIPYPLVVGFTSGIAVVIFTSQIKDFMGFDIQNLSAGFLDKWHAYFTHFFRANLYAVLIAVFTVIISLYFSKIIRRIPGSIIAILICTICATAFHLPVETIGSRFGDIPSHLPKLTFPAVSLHEIRNYIQPAFTIAILGAIESLLSAVVADGMIGGNHRSNTELIAQGTANIFSSLMGGIPATGAIARTATNIKNGGKTPVAGIVHAIVLLLIMLFFGKWAKQIPLACLAGILVVVSYNMSEWKSFVSILRGSKYDILVLLTTFFLTVLVDLTFAIEVGLVLASFAFMQRMILVSKVHLVDEQFIDEELRPDIPEELVKPDGVDVYEVNGPFFFGAANKFREVLNNIHSRTGILIIRMRNVPFIDATGIHNFREMLKEFNHKKVKVILSGVKPGVYNELVKARLVFLLGKKNIHNNINDALKRAGELIEENNKVR